MQESERWQQNVGYMDYEGLWERSGMWLPVKGPNGYYRGQGFFILLERWMRPAQDSHPLWSCWDVELIHLPVVNICVQWNLRTENCEWWNFISCYEICLHRNTLKFLNVSYVHIKRYKLMKFIFKRFEFLSLQPVLVMISQLICGEFHCCPLRGPECLLWSVWSAKDFVPCSMVL